MKKYILGMIIALSVPFAAVFASSPQLNVSGSGDGNNVLVTIINADGNSPIGLYFKSNIDGVTRTQTIGTTNGVGQFSGTVSTTGVGIDATTPVYTIINGFMSNNLLWPYQAGNNNNAITFSQNNPNVAVGQSGSMTVTGGAGTYYISSNSNSAIISATISGNTLSYSGIASGSSVITVCAANSSLCSSITISTTGSNGGLSINPSSLVLTPGQYGTLTMIGGTLPYTVTTTSGDSMMYSANGNSISIGSSVVGTRVLNICSSNNVCNSITVSVAGTANTSISLNPSTLSIAVNQTGTVQISGGNGQYYVSTLSGGNLQTQISGNTLSVSSQTSGTRTLNICSSSSACSTIIVTITDGTQSTNTNFTIFLAVNDTIKINMTGGNGSAFYVQSGVSSPVMASMNNTVLSVTGKSLGTSLVTVCQNGNGTCAPFMFNVNQSDTSNNGTGGPYTFTSDMWYGQTNNDVAELQKFLIGENYLQSGVTGYFGTLTLAAVKQFQSAQNISMTGYVGTLTREALNK
jgi:peptidoglycan hydrolase-like protein with peptidoglycan-binding domain